MIEYYLDKLMIPAILLFVIGVVVRSKRINKHRSISSRDIYKYLYQYEIGLSNGDVLRLQGSSDYDKHNRESFLRYYYNIQKNPLNYVVNLNGENITINKNQISFEKIYRLR